ncbi:hypothetical protein M413DRAFT_448146 [Hebeloma cylindrosporum]|uniref:acylaminoacyl-peptidase n=1 Tax=Hebeloma cylindrosporum TaxID=76867 RepID=A0A0C3C2M7_HEBCY|nr:hypothetical protein M413DRAFT_448146 [Hebeloma cylindrosporum h7]
MYEQLAEIPVPTAAQFISKGSGQDVVQVSYSVRDHISKTKRTMVKSLVYSYDGLSPTATPLQDTDVVGQIVSPSGKRRAALRSVKNSNGSTSRFVEIWTDDLLQTALDVSDYHHDFYTDEFLSSLSFSPSESAILYTAEAKAPETEDIFQRFRFDPDFGEGLSGKKRPAIFLFRWDISKGGKDSSPSLIQLKTREDVRFGQAIFSSSSDKIIYATGYEFTSDGRMLGVKGCFNRPSGIWQLMLSSIPTTEAPPEVTSKKISPASHSCRSPRIVVHEGRAFLVWLGGSIGGAHIACNLIYRHEITSDGSKDLAFPDETPLIPIIDTPGSDGFPGLYPAYNLPKSASIQVLGSQAYLLLHSNWGSRTTVLRISLIDGSVKNLTPANDDLYSWSVLTTNGLDSVICSRSSPSVPYEIMLGKFNSDGVVTWALLDKPQLPGSVSKALGSIRTSVIPIPERGLVETILIQASSIIGGQTKLPCILVPHGGPHAASTTVFSATTTALALEGYTLSFPNYTGSPGYGEEFIQGLIGRCGDLDVQDCIASARYLIKLGISEEGPGKQFITGGSHGGFLGAHLIGQFPDFFSGAALRNPVISVGELSTTDIPDWYFAEFGLEYPISTISNEEGEDQKSTFQRPRLPPRPPLVTGEIFSKLQLVSPIAHLDAIRAPVLLLVGAADRRVAPTHGVEFYHALKGRYAAEGVDVGKKVEMLIFEGESHPLDGVEAARANFEATKEWFLRARASRD